MGNSEDLALNAIRSRLLNNLQFHSFRLTNLVTP